MVISKKVQFIFLFNLISLIAFCQNDVGVTYISRPPADGCYASNERVECVVENFLVSTVDFAVDSLVIFSSCNYINFPLIVIKSGSLAGGASMNVVIDTAFDMSAEGNYRFLALTQLHGDTSRWNDTYIVIRRGWYNLPLAVGFQSYNGSNLDVLFPQWYEAQGLTFPETVDTSYWTNLDMVGVPVNTAARVSMNSSLNRKLHEWIVGPKFIPLLGSSLSFDVAVSAFDTLALPGIMGNNASLSVMLTADCGTSWQGIYSLNHTSGLTQAFSHKTVDLTPYAGQKIGIAFLASDTLINPANSYDFILDNILLMTPPQYDAGVSRILTPDDTLGIYSDYRVKVRIKNFGELPLDTIPVSFEIGSYAPIEELWTGSLAKNDSVEYTFTTSIDSLLIDFAICAYTSLPGDELAANDKKCKIVKGLNDSGVEDRNNAVFSLGVVFPNPASSGATIPVSVQRQRHIVLKLINIFGQTVMQKELDFLPGNHQIHLDLESLKSGLYYISAECGDDVSGRKLIIQ